MHSVFALAFVTGVYVLALGIIIPVLPFQILALGGSPAQATLIYSVFSGVSVLTLRFWGQMSDRFGRTPILWLSVFATSLSYLWLAYASTLWEVYAARALAGAFAAWLPVSQALISDIVPSAKRAPAMGLLGVGFGFGFTIGPALGGYLASTNSAEYDFWTPFGLASLVSFATLLATLALVREPAKRTQKAPDRSRHSVLRDKPLLAVMILYFCVSVLFTGIEGVLAVWGERQHHWQPKDIGYLLMIAGVGSIVSQGFLIRLANKRLREAKTALLSIAGLFVSVTLLAMSQGFAMIALGLLLTAIFIGLHNPAIQSLISQIAPEDIRGKILGIAQATASTARVIGPLWAGLVFQTWGGNSPFFVAIVFAITLFGLGLIVLPQHFPPQNHDKNSSA